MVELMILPITTYVVLTLHWMQIAPLTTLNITIRLIGISNSANSDDNTIINIHDATNSYNLTSREDSNENNSYNIDTSNFDFGTFLNNEVVADGTGAEKL